MFAELKNYLKLNVEYAKLTAAEKVTRLLSMMAFVAIVFILGLLAFLFFTIALADLLAIEVGTAAAYGILCAFYILLIICVVVFRKPLIINPLSKFMTKLFLS